MRQTPNRGPGSALASHRTRLIALPHDGNTTRLQQQQQQTDGFLEKTKGHRIAGVRSVGLSVFNRRISPGVCLNSQNDFWKGVCLCSESQPLMGWVPAANVSLPAGGGGGRMGTRHRIYMIHNNRHVTALNAVLIWRKVYRRRL